MDGDVLIIIMTGFCICWICSKGL